MATVLGQDARMGRVWVVGSLNVDRRWRVDRHPHVGETVVGEVLPSLPGGKGLNQAVAAARMGADVALVGAVGDDGDGTWLLDVATAEGIDVDTVEVVADTPTGSALIVVAADGANTVAVAPGANGSACFDDVPVGPGDVVVAQLEVPVDTVSSALEAARSLGARSVLNPSPLGPSAERVDALVTGADVLVVNQHEAAELLGEQVVSRPDRALEQAARLRRPGQAVVITLGAAGLVACDADGQHTVAGRKVHAIDTTGAGDCFLGTLAAGLAEDRNLHDVLLRANRAAALSTTRAGTVPAMPTLAELS